MSTFVFVPGGWHGGWWFQPLVERLRQHGHHAYAVTLTGVGERRHLATPSTNLDTHIEDLTNVLEYEDLSDVVLCAHSYGGMVAAGAVERVPERIGSLVFLDAQVPRDGESLWSLTTDRFREMFTTGARDGFSVSPPPGLDPRTTSHPLATFLQPVRLARGLDQIERKVFVYMSGWADSPLLATYDRVRDDPGWEARQWATGHDMIGEAFEETVELLLREASLRSS